MKRKIDENAKARLRAGRRAENYNGGKPLEENVDAISIQGFEDGGIVEAAKKEAEMVDSMAEEDSTEEPATEEPAEAEISEEPGETVEEAETPEEAEAEKEPKTAIEQFAEEESEEPQHQTDASGKTDIEQFAEEESQEPQHQQPVVPANEYTPPEGETHDALIDAYHQALVYGDPAEANAIYKLLQEHRYRENAHRMKSEAQAEQEEAAFVQMAEQFASEHPELAEDSLEAKKVLALMDVYRREGAAPAAALQKAVADVYPAMPEPVMGETMTEEPVMEEAKVEEPVMEEAKVEEPTIPDMAKRRAMKRALPAMPNANAKNEPAPEPKEPTRSDAIAEMKKRRGQVA